MGLVRSLCPAAGRALAAEDPPRDGACAKARPSRNSLIFCRKFGWKPALPMMFLFLTVCTSLALWEFVFKIHPNADCPVVFSPHSAEFSINQSLILPLHGVF